MRFGKLLFCLLFASACDWRPFDELEDNPPVAKLKKPEALEGGFGVSLAVAPEEDGSSARVMVGGSPGENRAAVFLVGPDDGAPVDAVDTAACDGQFGACYQANQVAGLGMARTGQNLTRNCFIPGIGISAEADRHGLIGRCQDSTEYTLEVPDDVYTELIADTVLFNDAPEPLLLVTDKDPSAALLATAQNQGFAWYYAPESRDPVRIVPPDPEEVSFGGAAAVLRMSDGARLYAIGAPDAGHVWLFRSEEGTPAQTVGCLSGGIGYGRTLAAGRVDEDDLDDLVLATGDALVTVYSGMVLDRLLPAAEVQCSAAALPGDGVLASFGCGSRGSVTGCPGGFGDALAVGDLDGDGDGEVLVGAPGFTVREEVRAGAVLVYDVEGEFREALTEALFTTAREQDDRLGSAVVAAPIDGRDVVIAGAPGNGRAYAFYCSSLVPDDLRGSRCQ